MARFPGQKILVDEHNRDTAGSVAHDTISSAVAQFLADLFVKRFALWYRTLVCLVCLVCL